MNNFSKRKIPSQLKRNNRTGFSLVEIVIGAAIITLSLTGLMVAFQSVAKLEKKNIRMVQASYLTEEGLEVVRALRVDGWDNIASFTSGANYYLSYNAGAWVLNSTPTMINNLFERKIIIDEVNRDGSHEIAEAGTLDTGTKKITVSVAWRDGSATTTKTVATYLTNIFE